MPDSRPEPALARFGSPSSYRQPAPAYNDLVNGRRLWRENRAEQRIFSSPVALAFVRTPLVSGWSAGQAANRCHPREDVGPCASPISPQDVSLLEPVRRCFDCVLDAVEIGAVQRGHVETPLVAYRARRRKVTTRTSSPRPWQSLAPFSGALLEPTDLSANMPSCPPILAAADQRKPPASRKAQSRRTLPLALSTRLESGKPLWLMKGSRGAAS